MIDKLSTRQKTVAAVSLLGLPAEEKQALDLTIASTIGHPAVGAMFGVDINSVETLIETCFNISNSDEPTVFPEAARLLGNPKIRGFLAEKFIMIVQKQPPELRNAVATVMTNLAELDVPEFQKEFTDVKHFIEDGLLLFVSNNAGETVTVEDDLHICPECGYIT